jgi:lysophospholipase L1-like esterase
VPRAENTVSRLAALRPDLVLLNLGRAALTPPQAVELHRRLTERERFDLLLLNLSDNDLNDLAATPELGPDCRLPEHPLGWRRRVMASLVGASTLLTRMRLRAREWWDGLHTGATAPADAADPGLEARLVSCLRRIAARQPMIVAILPDGRRPLTAASQAAGRDRVALYTRAAREAGAVAVIDAWSAFGPDPLGDGRMVNGFPNSTLGKGHFNPLGHARLAEVLAEGLAPLLPAAERVPQVAQGMAQGMTQGMTKGMAR